MVEIPSWSDIAPDFLTDRGNLNTLRDFLEKPEGFVLGIVFSAIIGGILDIGRSVIDAVRYIWQGSDSTVGIVDLPRLLVQPVIDSLDIIGSTLLTQLEAILRMQIALFPDLWLFGPVVAYGFVTLELVALGWLTWQIIRSIDVPLVNLGPILSALAAPVRTILRVIR